MLPRLAVACLLLGALVLAAGAAPPSPAPRAEGVVRLPALTVQMGSARQPDEQPVHAVSLPAFSIDRREVRLAEYSAFDPGGTGAGPDHPVVYVSFSQASAYCAHRGGRLPTEEEWERACKSTRGGTYPWGEGPNPAAVWWEEEKWGKYGLLPGITTVAEPDPSTATPEGVYELAGSVWEWTTSGYHRDSYADPSKAQNSPWKVVRGGSYANLPSYATCTHREPARPDEPRLTLGFRCVYP